MPPRRHKEKSWILQIKKQQQQQMDRLKADRSGTRAQGPARFPEFCLPLHRTLGAEEAETMMGAKVVTKPALCSLRAGGLPCRTESFWMIMVHSSQTHRRAVQAGRHWSQDRQARGTDRSEGQNRKLKETSMDSQLNGSKGSKGTHGGGRSSTRGDG